MPIGTAHRHRRTRLAPCLEGCTRSRLTADIRYTNRYQTYGSRVLDWKRGPLGLIDVIHRTGTEIAISLLGMPAEITNSSDRAWRAISRTEIATI